MLCETDCVSKLHAADHVSKSGVCDQQVRGPSVLADTGFKVREVPGAAHPGTRKCIRCYKRARAYVDFCLVTASVLSFCDAYAE